jgi:phosphate starvation-inducible PhoH-like protein
MTTNTQKRKPKGDISFRLTLNEEQKNAKTTILENDVNVIVGKAGSGKTALAVNIALDMFFKRDVDRIYICRPTVAKEQLGFLPGDIMDKLDPWLQPIYQNMYTMYDKAKIEKHLADGDIQILPLAFMKGVTVVNSVFVVDEVQNVSNQDELWMIISRLGIGSKLILCGDEKQIDLKNKKHSAIHTLEDIAAKEIEGFSFTRLHANHRHPILERLEPLFT